jgi:transcriptional regulator with XRE-family HTH domain
MSECGNVRYCQTCGARLARDNLLTRCTPCQNRALNLALGPPDLPASFWEASPMREALASWHIGQVIRAYRHHPLHGQRPLSQDLVASWLRLTQTQLSRVENGLPVKDLDKLTDWAQVLQIPPGMLWFQLPEADGPAVPQPATVSQGGATVEVWPSSAFRPAELWPQLAATTAIPGCDGSSDAAAMHAFRAADLQVGGGHLYAAVVSYLQTALAPRLFGTVAAGPMVFTAASTLTEMAGWMAHDAGRDVSARQHFAQALNLATAGDDIQLRVHILASMSHLALHQGRPEQAIRFAWQGQEALGAIHAPGLAAHLLAMQARGLAGLPQPEPAACGRALLQAEQTLDEEPGEQPSPWISRFDEGSLASEAARCLRQLLLAGVLVAQGEPERACALAQEVLDATRPLSSYLVLQQLRELARDLEPYQSSQAVAVFLASLNDALRQRLSLYSWLAADAHQPGTAMEPGR